MMDDPIWFLAGVALGMLLQAFLRPLLRNSAPPVSMPPVPSPPKPPSLPLSRPVAWLREFNPKDGEACLIFSGRSDPKAFPVYRRAAMPRSLTQRMKK